MTEKNHALEQAQSQLSSIVAMVAALECDYDRLEELRDARDSLREEFDADPANDGVDFDNWVRNQAGFSTEEADELKELEEEAGDCKDEDAARTAIMEDPLEVQVRGDWHAVGAEDGNEPSEFYVLLCTGGPAVRIMGELDEHNEPSRAWIEYQDWGTPWTELVSMESAQREALLTYCQQFVFGE
jgi:hypothetical protein